MSESNVEQRSEKPVGASYSAPKLTEFGTIEQWTRGGVYGGIQLSVIL